MANYNKEGGTIMKKTYFQLLLVLCTVFLASSYVAAHCEIPCGIYDDAMRVKMIDEHITTIEKSMNQVVKLQGEQPVNYNQLVRWVTNKETHANELQEIVTQYFMTQRIKPDATKYQEKLTLLHQMLLHAMKCKQTTDLSEVTTLRSLLKQFDALYFEGEHK
jgi:nickel superoxide dismutase